MENMRLGIVSDSHGRLESTRKAIVLLESLDVDQVLHCGDVGSPEVIELFSSWPTHFVGGNCDDDPAMLAAAALAAGQNWHGPFGDLEFAGVRTALLHSHDERCFQRTVASGDWKLVCYGHTHVAKMERPSGTLLLNPGALHRARPLSLAIVDLPSLEAHIIPLEH